MKKKTRRAIAAMVRVFSWPLSDRLLGERGDRSDYRLIPVEVVPLVSENAGNSGKASDHQADNC
ncbi:hypothetical protein HGG72_11120 [Ochrobactrum pecoris]|nr:hypothetical protein [Brucella pecoris]